MTRDELADLFLQLKSKMINTARQTTGNRLQDDEYESLYVEVWDRVVANEDRIKDLNKFVWTCYYNIIRDYLKSAGFREQDSLCSLTDYSQVVSHAIDEREREAYQAERQEALVHAVLERIEAILPKHRMIGWYVRGLGHPEREAAQRFRMTRAALRKYLSEFDAVFKEFYKDMENKHISVNLPEPVW